MRLTLKEENNHYEIIELWEERDSFDTITKQDVANQKLGQLEDDEEELKLRDLHEFLQCLEPNTLFRIMPYEKAKIIDEFRRKFVKEELL